ncbi:MAG: helix-turn-helix domain-containing protein, partial [Candidatus Accumulibacter sp.]|nr:helix-turn-helix domain-containing protein [Accumulibacter sp.]
MRFEEAYGGCEAGRLTQAEASRLLGVCERTFRRCIDRYEESGLDGLIDRRLEQASSRRAPVDEAPGLTESYRRRHEGWSAKHFYAWYKKDGSTHEWAAGQKWDLIVTLDDATSEHYSMFFVDEEGTASSLRGVKEVIEARGLFSSFY